MITNLPFISPIITHVPFDNCLLGILQNYPKTYDWIYSNFLNIYFNKKNGADYFFPKFLWTICPFIDAYSVPYILIKKNFQSYTDFLEHCIEKNFYVYNLLNVKYIKKYATNINTDHNSFLTNINTEQKIVQMHDFFNDGIYESYNCSYSEINTAFDNFPQCKGYNIDYYLNDYSQIILLRYNPNREYKFNYSYFKQNIKNYLNSDNLLSKYSHSDMLEDNLNDSFYWGIDCWNHIGEKTIAKRHFSLLYAHSKMWQLRYNHFIEKGYFDKSKTIETNIIDLNNTAKIILNLYLKSTIKSNKNFSFQQSKIDALTNDCLSLEHTICNYFLQDSNYNKLSP